MLEQITCYIQVMDQTLSILMLIKLLKSNGHSKFLAHTPHHFTMHNAKYRPVSYLLILIFSATGNTDDAFITSFDNVDAARSCEYDD